MLRVVMLLLVGLSAWAQELEEFRLKDGRSFVGNYDDKTKMLSAHIGGGIITIEVAPDRIASRGPFHPPAPAVITQPDPPKASPPELVAQVPKPVERPPLQVDRFAINQPTRDKEMAVLGRITERVAANKDASAVELIKLMNSLVDDELNPMNGAMLLQRRVGDAPVRHRCLVALATEHPGDLVVASRYWVLTMYGADGKAFAYLVADRETPEGVIVEQALRKDSMAVLHAWISKKPGRYRDAFMVERIVSTSWAFDPP